ncbi:kinetochore component CENP-S-domain-containing protein [Plectosphaerella plurivora]|uniref:Kinetochore component CENP-S-domain-containing protein n=1 Tax=Plectosphaerella plurivora TaxID=936078 RepID=A0A9P8VDP4_9PEZI|nr:kinetochore component CENP-S-domain-containing protein [Plectosphaerella plurivora]
MADATKDERQERLKAALWFSVGQMVDEEVMKKNRNATPQFIGALTEMVWEQIASTAADLESFSRHAGRSTITTDDVLLLARKNPDLLSLVQDYVDDLNAKKVEAGNAKGKGKAGR